MTINSYVGLEGFVCDQSDRLFELNTNFKNEYHPGALIAIGA